ncbi:MAG: rod shape-determining protein MreC [Pleurocapsa sp.]
MSRWWDKYGSRILLLLVATLVAFAIKLTQASAFSEAYYFVVRPFQSQKQLVLEDRLTNARILELEQQVIELEQQNQQLKQLLNYAETIGEETVTAPVIGRSRDRWWNRVTLGKGSKDGIKKGYIVMGIGGVVGRVTHTTPHTSKVLLVSDTTSRVGATVSRNRQLGYVRGKDSSTAVMKFFNQVADIKPGDEIATSNLSKLYHPGLPIGKVKSHQITKNDTSEIEIELTAPIDVLEWVNVQSFDNNTINK